MSAALPLLILSTLSVIILVIWSLKGAKSRNSRILSTLTFVFLLIVSWAILIIFGVFHPVGFSAMGISFIICIGASFVPMVHRKLNSNKDT